MNFSAIRERVAVDVVRHAPKGLYSEMVGWGARCTVPRPLRSTVYTAFARLVGARLDEVELPLSDYRSLSSFFARRLRSGARPVCDDDGAVFPSDGRIASVGRAVDGELIQAKGQHYRLADLVVDDELAEQLDGGTYVTIYLSPKDYHRVHAPCEAKLLGYDYVPGTLFPVNATWAAHEPELFARNERLVIHLDSELGRIAVVMVGAFGVGNMTFAADGLQTRTLRGHRDVVRVRFDEPIHVTRGAELGCFELGSTVVVVFEPDRIDARGVETGAVVRVGRPIAGDVSTQRGDAAA